MYFNLCNLNFFMYIFGSAKMKSAHVMFCFLALSLNLFFCWPRPYVVKERIIHNIFDLIASTEERVIDYLTFKCHS